MSTLIGRPSAKKIFYLPDVLTRMMPQPSAQHQPTKQKRTVKAWKMPIVKLMMKASNLCSVVTRAENLGAPRHMPSNPLRIVPFYLFSRPKIYFCFFLEKKRPFTRNFKSFHLFQEGVRSVLSKSTPDLGEGRAELLWPAKSFPPEQLVSARVS